MTNLADAAPGSRLRIESVSAREQVRLARHGLVAGVELVCDQDAPFHGPRIVTLGARRVAVPRSVAREILVTAVPGGAS